MKYLLLTTLITCLILCVLVLSMLLIGHAHPDQPLLTGLVPCDESLCYRGIALLKTPYDVGRSIIENLPGASWSVRDIRRADLPQGDAAWLIIFRSNNDRVRELDLRPRSNTLTLGKVITHLDIPCAVYAFRPGRAALNTPPLVILAYPAMYIWVETHNWRLAPNLRIREINLMPELTSEIAVKPCNNINQPVKYKWEGFRQYPYAVN
jgi:hypothetical protein